MLNRCWSSQSQKHLDSFSSCELFPDFLICNVWEADTTGSFFRRHGWMRSSRGSFEGGGNETWELVVAVHLWSSEQSESEFKLTTAALVHKSRNQSFLHPSVGAHRGRVFDTQKLAVLNHLFFVLFPERREEERGGGGGCTLQTLWVLRPVSSTLFKPRVRPYRMNGSHPRPRRPADV